MDSRPHLIPRGTHIMCPLYICMHTHAGPLVLSFARHAPLPSCLTAWAEHRNCFCFVFIALSGQPLSLSPVCVFCFTGAMRVCALVVPRFGFCFVFHCFVVESTHSAGCVCDDISIFRVCYLLFSLPFLPFVFFVPHICAENIGADKQKYAVWLTLWSGVNAENARTHKFLIAVAIARRHERRLLFVSSTRCGCDVCGVQSTSVVGCAFCEFGLIPAQQLHVPKFLSRCGFADGGFSACAGDVRLWRLRSGSAGRMNSKRTGGSASVLRRAVVLFCIPLFVLPDVGVARCVLTRGRNARRDSCCWW
ncbi:hypothetical protein ECC02_010829 [Trypanosoma cruzi]|uniref:Uncharacterized protein n=1 Tax=Trypanosoma cruzi TaxID=5693 RepID=A0A7J6XPN9_TRYCR|nr:hypothetical protein ECC02_010829 [Trypanosoma cruzi]